MHGIYAHVNTFLDDLASNSLQPQILLPTRMFNNSKTLIDKRFCNIPNPLVTSAMSGNISSSILDHLLQFFILTTRIIFKFPPPQLNITLYPMTGKNSITSHFLKILKRLIGI